MGGDKKKKEQEHKNKKFSKKGNDHESNESEVPSFWMMNNVCIFIISKAAWHFKSVPCT